MVMAGGASAVPAQENGNGQAANGGTGSDSTGVSLLTCSPRNAIYGLYGHTAIRYWDKRTGMDWTFNYGIFNFSKPYFELRFALGKTDYELGVLPYYLFKSEYSQLGCQVNEQPLNLSDDEKERVIKALETNYRPENRVYRYNFFYNNCTTRARDIIESCIDGDIVYPDYADNDTAERQTFREAIHVYTAGHPWAALGNDLALGIKADLKMSLREHQFLPEYLMADFDGARICTGGKYRPLVKENKIIVEKKAFMNPESMPDLMDTIFTPTLCALIFMALSAGVALLELKRRKTLVLWDLFLMTATGTAGLILLLLFFSEHPATSTNLQILLLNPMSFIFIPAMAMRKKTIYWKLSAILAALLLPGMIFQDYAEGFIIVALSLQIRNWINMRLSAGSSRITRQTNSKEARNQ